MKPWNLPGVGTMVMFLMIMRRELLLGYTLATMLFSLTSTAEETVARWPQFRGPGGLGIANGQTPPEQFGPTTNLLWKTPLPAGHSSPCVWDGRVFLTAQAGGKLETLCISRADGKVLWHTSLAAERLETINGTNSLATATPTTDGQRVFSIIDTNNDGFITADEYAPIYKFLKQGRPGLFAMRTPGKGDVTETHKLWTWSKPISTVISPLFHRGRIYLIREGGMLTCLDARTGAPIYENKRVGATGDCFASPLATDGRIYLASRNGVVAVVESGDEMKVVALNDIGERIVATPAIADNKLYIRTEKHLWAFGRP